MSPLSIETTENAFSDLRSGATPQIELKTSSKLLEQHQIWCCTDLSPAYSEIAVSPHKILSQTIRTILEFGLAETPWHTFPLFRCYCDRSEFQRGSIDVLKCLLVNGETRYSTQCILLREFILIHVP